MGLEDTLRAVIREEVRRVFREELAAVVGELRPAAVRRIEAGFFGRELDSESHAAALDRW